MMRWARLPCHHHRPPAPGTQAVPHTQAAPDLASGVTRRGTLGTTLKLAATASAPLAALPLGTAMAESERQEWVPRAWGRVTARGQRPEVEYVREGQWPPEWAGPLAATSAGFRLCRVADAPDGDVDRGNQGGDPLTGGALVVASAPGDGAGRVAVVLDGATANATYEVHLVRFKDKGRETVGQVTTNGSGDFGGTVQAGGTPARLSGNRRIAVFVFTRDGKDQFVTCLPTAS
jgi:hypothetical protein